MAVVELSSFGGILSTKCTIEPLAPPRYPKRGASSRSEAVIARETVASRRFMRGTDPIKSTWVYPKLIL
jgi:hypothetical protein